MLTKEITYNCDPNMYSYLSFNLKIKYIVNSLYYYNRIINLRNALK